MGITISGPSTQIPTNVVEIGNEISQNAINAIANAYLPSTGNPMMTTASVASQISGAIVSKVNNPTASWPYAFPVPTNIPLGYLNGNWAPLASSGTVFGYDYGASYGRSNSYYFDFTDNAGNYITLNGSANVGLDNVTYYYASGNYDGVVSDGITSTTYSGTGPSYAGNWDNPINYGYFFDGSNYLFRYVYLDGSGGFYTADNANNPPS